MKKLEYRPGNNTIWTPSILYYTHPRQAAILTIPLVVLVKFNISSHVAKSGSCLGLQLLNMLTIFHLIFHFLLFERLSSFSSWEAMLLYCSSCLTDHSFSVFFFSSSLPQNTWVSQGSIPDLCFITKFSYLILWFLTIIYCRKIPAYSPQSVPLHTTAKLLCSCLLTFPLRSPTSISNDFINLDYSQSTHSSFSLFYLDK